MDRDSRLRFFRYIIVYAKSADAKLPGSYRIGTKGLAVPCFDGCLVGQLFVDRIEHNGTLTSGEPAQMFLGHRGEDDAVWHERKPFCAVEQGIPPKRR